MTTQNEEIILNLFIRKELKVLNSKVNVNGMQE